MVVTWRWPRWKRVFVSDRILFLHLKTQKLLRFCSGVLITSAVSQFEGAVQCGRVRKFLFEFPEESTPFNGESEIFKFLVAVDQCVVLLPFCSFLNGDFSS